MYALVRSRVATLALVAAAVAASGPSAAVVHAQDATSGPTTSTSRFTLPASTDLANDAGRSVDDIPDALSEQDDLTPVLERAQRRLGELAAEDWDVAALAATLPDTASAFTFVRDAIGFDAYRGQLRGAQGALSARAGNAWDRASLLRDLLVAQGLTTRYAFGTLDGTTATTLVARSFETPVTSLPGADLAFTDAFETAVDGRARRDHARILAALDGSPATFAADATPDAVLDVAAHAWVQVEQPDGSWLDLDPTLPDAEPGDTLTAVSSTGDAVPASEQHTVGVRVVAEHLVGSELQQTTVLDETLPAAAAADKRIFVAFTPAGESGGLLDPGGLLGGGGTPSSWVPTLLVDHNAWDGDAILFTGELGGGGLLGPGEQADLVSLAIEVTMTSPDAEPRMARQVLADRLSPEARAAGSLDASVLAPVADDDGTPAIFGSVVHVLASTGAIDPRAYALDQGYAAAMTAWAVDTEDIGDLTLAEALVPAAVADESFVVAAERRFIPTIDDTAVRAFVAEPRLTLVTRATDIADPARTSVVTDLAFDGLRTVAADGDATAAAARQLWYGALQGAFETEYALANASGLEAEGRILEGVSFGMDQPLTVVTSASEDRPVAADTGLDSILANGGLAVVPGDVATARAWWEIGPDAATRSVLAPRLGGGGASGVGGPRRPILPVGAPDKPRDQRKQQDDGKNGNEYGTVVENVAGKVEKGARSGGRVVRDGWDVVKKPLVKI